MRWHYGCSMHPNKDKLAGLPPENGGSVGKDKKNMDGPGQLFMQKLSGLLLTGKDDSIWGVHS